MRRILPAIAAALFAGCGYTGDPLPPLANIPERVQAIQATQRGSALVIGFPVPQRTTEGLEIEGPVRVDLRIGAGDASNPEAWAAQAEQAQGGGVTEGVARYEIPVGEWIGKDVLLGARVIGANGKAGNWSGLVSIHVIPPPQTPSDLSATATPQGVRLTWRAHGEAFRVFRRAEGQDGFTAAATSPKPEWVDPGADFGKGYAYRVQTVSPLPNGGEAVSELSQQVSIIPQDVFPPAAPSELKASPAAATIELNWEGNTEAYLGGYRVYRSIDGGEFVNIAEVALIPAYSDSQVEHGRTYRYCVTAVSKTGYESSRSPVIEATFP